MIFIFFTMIIFIAELIIVFTILFNLIKLDIYINKTNEILIEAKPKIQEVSEWNFRTNPRTYTNLG